jgi:hypothetical protein
MLMTQLEVTAYSVWVASLVARYRRAGDIKNALQMLHSTTRICHNKKLVAIASNAISYKQTVNPNAKVIWL